jgi:hypothetical protein
MRWLWVMMLVASGCVQPDAPPSEERPSVASQTPKDVCIPWDGRNGYCFGVTEYVFIGGRCHGTCAASRGPSGATFFETAEDCVLACACRPEKFSVSFSVGDSFDECWAIADAGDPAWEGCVVGPADQRCPLDIAGTLDSHGMATLCAASAYPMVRQIVCASAAR